MPSNSMREHFERTRAKKSQEAKLEAQRPLGRSLQSAAAATTRVAEKLYDTLGSDRESTSGGSDETESADNFELRMFYDLQRLKNIQSIKGAGGKVELKGRLFPNYIPYIDGTLAVASPVQNDVLMHLMVWALDIGEYQYALRIAEYALLNGLVMPDPYARDTATIFAEQLADGLIDDPDVATHADLIAKAIDLVRGFDMVDQARAKLYKAQGLALAAYRPSEAIIAYEQALRLDSKVGVKQVLDKLKRDMGKHADPESPRDAPSGSQDTSGTPSAPAADPASTAPSTGAG